MSIIMNELPDMEYPDLVGLTEILGWKDITTKQQKKNGTVQWQLPIKNNWPRQNPSYIEVASFKAGYVRRQNGCYTPYQLNKRCEGEPEYFDSGKKDSLGRPMYTKFTARACVLIPNEQDRLEYLISFCLKNYYIGYANKLSSGEFVPKWKYEDAEKLGYSAGLQENIDAKPAVENLSVIVNNERYKIL